MELLRQLEYPRQRGLPQLPQPEAEQLTMQQDPSPGLVPLEQAQAGDLVEMIFFGLSVLCRVRAVTPEGRRLLSYEGPAVPPPDGQEAAEAAPVEAGRST